MALSTIAAVVPSLGASPHLADCLAALRRAGGAAARVETVLVWQGAAGVPPEEVAAAADRVLAPGRPLGFAAATNLGIAAVTAPGEPGGAELVATVNDDVVVEPGWAEALAEALGSHPGAAAAQGVNLMLRPAGEAASVDGCGIGWNRAWQAVQLGRGGPPPPMEEPPREVFGVSATAALYRREALAAAARLCARDLSASKGPFDEGLGSYYEDVELACRLRASGGSALLVPRARARHAGSATGSRTPVRRWGWIYGNRYLVLARLLGGRFWRELPRAAGRDLADLGGAVARGRGRLALGILAGWARAARRLPAWAHRGEPLLPLEELARFRDGRQDE